MLHPPKLKKANTFTHKYLIHNYIVSFIDLIIHRVAYHELYYFDSCYCHVM